MSVMSRTYASFAEFYPFYLSQHADRTCRRLHVVGSTLVLALLVLALGPGPLWLAWLVPLAGYGFAWVGHFGFERNKPATFQYPAYSLMGDWVMYWQVISGKIPF